MWVDDISPFCQAYCARLNSLLTPAELQGINLLIDDILQLDAAMFRIWAVIVGLGPMPDGSR